MAFIQFNKNKKVKPEYEYGVYAGSLLTLVVVLLFFIWNYFRNGSYWSMINLLISLVIINTGLFLWAKARSPNIIEENQNPNSPLPQGNVKTSLANFERKSKIVLTQSIFLLILFVAFLAWLIWASGNLWFIVYFGLPTLGMVLSVRQLLTSPQSHISLVSQASYIWSQILFYAIIVGLLFTAFAMSMAFYCRYNPTHWVC
jgi:magnesium-transporting ATPase (P-type)